MPKPNLRVVDNQQEHPRDIAAKAIKRRRAVARPISNQHDTAGAPVLDVDETLKRAEPNYLVGKNPEAKRK